MLKCKFSRNLKKKTVQIAFALAVGQEQQQQTNKDNIQTDRHLFKT